MTQTALPTIPITERELTVQVITLAHTLGWLVAHFRPARRADGSWMTPLQGDGAGFPDLVLTRIGPDGEGRTIFAELKTARGRVDAAQLRWLRALKHTPGVEVYLWRPSQLQEIADALR